MNPTENLLVAVFGSVNLFTVFTIIERGISVWVIVHMFC
jgi:hypothetical protein